MTDEQQASTRLLVVDDEPAIRDLIAPFLGRAGYQVDTAEDGESALQAIATRRPQLVVLDVMMPGIDGREVLRRLRREDQWIPIILLTSVGESFERAIALEEGADDYLNKPFDPQELLARIRAILRRTVAGAAPLSASARLNSGELTVDRTSRRAWVAGHEVVLTPKAFALLEYLITHPDEVFTRERLLSTVWGFDNPVSTRAVDHRVAELRRVLGDDSAEPQWITTVTGLGYRFRGEVGRA